MSAVGAFTTVAVGTAINATSTVAKGKDPFPVLMAGVAFGTVCVGLDSITGSSIGTAFGAVFLLGSFLTNGVRMIETVNAVINATK